MPKTLSNECTNFLARLNGKAPINSRKSDTRGWGSTPGHYTVSQGYSQLISHPHVPSHPEPWNGIWSQTSILKIDTFCWLLCHKRILIDDRLQKRGYLGPSRCSLCGENEESAIHLMLSCNFAVEIWQAILGPWSIDFAYPTNISDLFSNWMSKYPGNTPKKKHIKAAWLALPKVI